VGLGWGGRRAVEDTGRHPGVAVQNDMEAVVMAWRTPAHVHHVLHRLTVLLDSRSVLLAADVCLVLGLVLILPYSCCIVSKLALYWTTAPSSCFDAARLCCLAADTLGDLEVLFVWCNSAEAMLQSLH
jgi:hypothetical protein